MVLENIELTILHFIQKFSTPFLDKFFIFVTLLGEETFYILIFAWLYWCYSKKFGTLFILTFLFGNCINAGLKDLFQMERPIGLDSIRTLREETATGYSFPSGHTQGACTFFYFLIHHLKKTYITVIGWILIILVGLSRLYLGVHWPKDVIVGILLALIIVHFGTNFFKEITLAKLLPLLAIFSVLMLCFTSKDYITGVAIFSGGIIGIYFERKYIGYSIHSSLKQNILKFIIGIAVLLLIKEGIKFLLPTNNIINYLRYFLVGLWFSFGSLFVFKKLRLEKKEATSRHSRSDC
jgi:membrane-associated phospholipid phosphatase